MAATQQEDIIRWLYTAKQEKATHMIVVCDTFGHEDYPVNVSKKEDIHDKIKEYDGKNMQSIMEVYNLSMDIEDQINEHRTYNI